MSKNKTKFEHFGRVMKDIVAVPAELLANTAALKPYLDHSDTQVQSLKPKHTRKKKKP